MADNNNSNNNNNGNGNGNGNGNSGNNGNGNNSDSKTIHGTAGNDTLTGKSDNEKIYGYAGNDILLGMNGNDQLFGGAGNDKLDGGNGNDKLDGEEGNDELIGGAGDDELSGGAGDDKLEGNDGNDKLDGGAGNDKLGGGNGNDELDGGEGNDELAAGAGNDKLKGGDGVDLLRGDAGNDKLEGGAGDDKLGGDDGNDELDGDAGNDEMAGGAGNDKLKGGDGADKLGGDDGNDELDGDAGNDEMAGGAGNDKLKGGDGADLLRGDAGNDEIEGGSGNDTIVWSAGDRNDDVDGGAGNDTFVLQTSNTLHQKVKIARDGNGKIKIEVDGAQGGDIELRNIERIDLQVGLAGASVTLGSDLPAGIFGDAPLDLGGSTGNDVINTGGSNQPVNIEAGAGNDQVTSGGGNDVIAGGTGADSISAGAGNDTVVWRAGDGNDSIDGGAGFDALDIALNASSADTLTVGSDANGNVILTTADGSRLKLDGIEDLIIKAGAAGTTITIGDLTGTDIAQDTLYFVGGAGNDIFHASATDRRINAQGGGGEDRLISGSANDILNGGDGNDFLDPGASSGVDVVNGDAGDDTIHMAFGDEQNSLAIDLVDGGTGNDVMNVTFNEPGAIDITLTVTGNSDGTFSITASDIDQNEAARVANVENLNIVAGEGGLNIHIGNLAGTSLAANGVNLIGSSASDALAATNAGVRASLRGNAGDDALTGGALQDYLEGGTGNDALSGEAGNDWLVGGTGDDILDGGLDWDGADYSTATGAIAVNLMLATNQVTGAAGTDTLANIEDIHGSAFADTMQGGIENDNLHGGAGSDMLAGGAGVDYLYGGAGNDTLVDPDATGLLSGDAGNDHISGVASYMDDPAAIKANLSAATVDGVVSRTVRDGYGDTDTLGTTVTNLFASRFNDQVTGSTQSDVLFGLAGADTIHGDDGNDLINGGSGADQLDGGAGYDTLAVLPTGFDSAGPALQGAVVDMAAGTVTDAWGAVDTFANFERVLGTQLDDTMTGDAADNALLGHNGNDLLNGAGGADNLQGMAGFDTLNGGSGNDLLGGGTGNDMLTGGAGADTFFFNTELNNTEFGRDMIMDFDVTQDVLDLAVFTQIGAISQLALTQSGGNSVITFSPTNAIVLVGVLPAQLTAANFVFGGAAPVGTIDGTAGNDTLTGTAGADMINGLAGDDTIAGMGGYDTLSGGDGADTYVFTSEVAGAHAFGHDVITDFNVGADTLDFTPFAALHTLALVQAAATTSGGNTLITIDANRTLTLHGVLPSQLGAGNFTFADPPPSGIVGTSGNDTLVGTAAAENIHGLDGNDRISGEAGADSLYGGNGSDHIDYSYDPAGVTVNLATGSAIDGYGHADILSNFENILGSKFADFLTGNDGDNQINGDQLNLIANPNGTFTAPPAAGGIDTIMAGGGNDVVNTGMGVDIADGGAGFDTITLAAPNLLFNQPGLQVTVNADGSITSFNSNNGETEVLLNFERVIGSTANDVLTGNAADNYLHGGIGNDTLNGGGGNDTAEFSGNSLFVDLAAGKATSSNPGSVTLISIENVIGTPSHDLIFGDAGNNRFDGLSGNDMFVGGAGNDVFNGGASGIPNVFDNPSPQLDGSDTVSYVQDPAGISVNLAANTATDGWGNTDTFMSIENVAGSNHADTLVGNADNNVLAGMGGSDTLTGGGGADTFELSVDYATGAANFGMDRVTDFDVANDAIGLKYLPQYAGFSAVTTLLSQDGADTLLTLNASSTVRLVNVTSSQLTAANFQFVKHLVLNGTPQNDVLQGDTGNDIINGNDGNDQLFGFAGADQMNGGNGSDVLYGGPGNDVLEGGASGDTLYGDDGNDTLNDSAGGGTLYGGAGNDLLSGSANDWNSLYGDAGDDVLVDPVIINGDNYSSSGLLYGGAGNDTLDGTPSYELDPAGIYANLSGTFGDSAVWNINGQNIASRTALDGWGDTDKLQAGVIGFTASQHADMIKGQDSFTQNFTLRAGADTLFGGGGFDWILGGSGADYLDGGADWDHVSYFDVTNDAAGTSSSGVVVNLFAAAFNYGGASPAAAQSAVDNWGDIDTLLNIEAMDGSAYNDVLIGSEFNNWIYGDLGNDALFGQGGDDDLIGGAGNDTLDGGAGDYDTVRYDQFNQPPVNGVTVNLSVLAPQFVSAEFGTDTLVNIENIQGSPLGDALTGNELRNDLRGWDGNDTLIGNGGDDNLQGQNGDDQMFGGAGFDWFNPGAGSDLIDGGSDEDGVNFDGWTGSTFAVTVDLGNLVNVAGTPFGNLVGVAVAADGFNNTDYLRNVENINGSDQNDNLTGNASNNSFWGRAGHDVLNGGDGGDQLFGEDDHDTLNGGAGDDNLHGGENDDQLTGGSGRDVFSFTRYTNDNNPAAFGADVIHDFNVQHDTLDLYNVPEFANLAALQSRIVSAPGAANVVIAFTSNEYGVTETNSITLIGITAAALPTMNIWYSSIRGTNGNDVLNGTANNDVIEGFAGNDVLNGFDNDDQLRGGAGNDTLNGGAGNDLLVPQSGADRLDGGDGWDHADYNWQDFDPGSVTFYQGVRINLSGSNFDLGASGILLANSAIDGAGFTDQIFGVEGIGGTVFADIIVGAGGSWLDGYFGNDRLFAAGNNDNMQGAEGNDILDGSLGDWSGASFHTGREGTGIVVDIAAGTALDGLGGSDTLIGIEVVNGSMWGDQIDGDTGVNHFYGYNGDDVLRGFAGNDHLSGDDGNDILDGGADGDFLIGGAGNDTFVFADGSGFDHIQGFESGPGVVDVIDLRAVTGMDDFADVQAAAVQIDTDTEINLGGGNVIRLIGTWAGNLMADDFLF